MTRSPKEERISRDFQRDVYCLLGLPVDNLTLQSTKDAIRQMRRQEESIVLATINVNWVVKSFADPQFRAAILNSDLVSLDGRPLLWLAKLLGYPMTEVVAGSTLIQELKEEKNAKTPLSLFLFGGEGDVAKQAMEQVNKTPGGLRAVGALNPGFGSIEAMSAPEIITAINKAEPDILLVALGAEKGTRWIEHNRDKLNAKVISHLGATVNFLAGTVRRAPKLFRSIGMEWVWRILQEPKLFTRYASDGLVLLRLVVARFFLWRQCNIWQKRINRDPSDEKIIQQDHKDEIVLSFGRNLQVTKDSPVRQVFSTCAHSGKNIILDFKKTEFMDGAFASLILLLDKHQQRNGNRIEWTNMSERLAKLFRLFCIQDKVRSSEK